MRNHRFPANIDELLLRDRKKSFFFSPPLRAERTCTTNRTRPTLAAASESPTGSCSILEQCRSGQRVRQPRAPQEIARSFITFLRFSFASPPDIHASRLLRKLPQDASRTPLRMAPTDLSHFPPLRDAGVMKRASPRVLRLEKRLLTSPEIPWTSTDKSS
jgi:hypothetical protein